MIHIDLVTNIYRPLTQVFSFISNPANDFQWQYGTVAAARIAEGESGLGSMFRTLTTIMGRRIESLNEVTEYEPNRRYGFKSLTGPVDSHTVYSFEMAAGSTRLTISTDLDQRDLFKISDAIVEKKFKRQYKENFNLLKQVLESSLVGRR
jgi:hypothetical protein